MTRHVAVATILIVLSFISGIRENVSDFYAV